jgi:hypothetical protein
MNIQGRGGKPSGHMKNYIKKVLNNLHKESLSI